ncbi:MAG: glycoside hydrolase family 5 protein, partial [Ruminiclostridium sp.]|nr:glycoside hydrolase family 5 protein [Ruminiclostridium sp.]
YVDNAVYWSNKVGGQDWLNYIDSQCELLKKAFTDKGIPVFLGETTSIYPNSNFASDAMHTDSTECLEIVLNKLDGYGFVPVLWDTSNNFYDRVTSQIKRESDKNLIATLSEK